MITPMAAVVLILLCSAVFASVPLWLSWKRETRLKSANATLANQVATLQAHPNSWQSGYNAGRKIGTANGYNERDHLNRLVNMANLDRVRLDSGMIIIAGRDEFGEPTRTHARGLNLRQLIDEAIEEHSRG